MTSGTAPVVVFDIDGTLLDSASGIVAGFAHALRAVGFDPPDEHTLRSDLGPPVGEIFTRLGLPAESVDEAVRVYRTYYLTSGLQQSSPYDGVITLLDRLQAAGVVLATATAKRTDIAHAIIDHHGLDRYFAVVNGTDDLRSSKAATLAHTLEQLGGPVVDRVIMVGDRHSDVTAARACGALPVAVGWGYGSADELGATGARVITEPAGLVAVPMLDAWLRG